MSSQPSGSARTMSASGQARAIPEDNPPPPHGITISDGGSSPLRRAGRGFRARPCPARQRSPGRRSSAPRVAPVSSAMPAAISSRLSVRPVVEDDFRPFGPRALDLHLRRIGRHHDHRPDPEPPRGDRHAARMIARGEGDHAVCPLFRRSCSSRLVAPLSLKAPPVCRHSHLSQTRTPATSLSISGVRSTRPAIRSAASTTSSRRSRHLSINRLIILPFRLAVAVRRHNDPKSPGQGPINLYLSRPPTYIAPRCPMGLPTARQLLLNLPVGGPLSCSSIIARWG